MLARRWFDSIARVRRQRHDSKKHRRPHRRWVVVDEKNSPAALRTVAVFEAVKGVLVLALAIHELRQMRAEAGSEPPV